MKKIIFLVLMVSLKLSSQDINYNVNSHHYKNEMNPYFDLIKIVENHGIEGPAYGGYDTGVAYADFNGDGYIDINLLLNPGSDGDFCEHFMLINNGDDTFTMDNTLIANTDFQTYMSRKTIVGDFNGDNKPDVVRIAGGHDWLRKSNILMSGNDQYTFMELDVVPESQYHGFASGDLDNDGDLDVFFGQPDSGFAMNDGSGNFTWYSVGEKISNYFAENTEQDGAYGVGTVEILDVNQDGNVDIVVGGSYANNSSDLLLMGPTILWGNGTSNYDYNNKTEIWGFGERPTMTDGSSVDNNDDFSFADIDNDGYLDVALVYIRQIDNDPDNNGGTTMSHYYQVMKGNSNTEFTDVTDEWLPDNIKYCTVVWIILKDIDQNGQLDLTEYAKTTYKAGSLPTTNCLPEAWRWEWNGSSFTTITGSQLSVEDEILDNLLKLYPNPTDNILFIKGNKNSINISIYNILGKEVLSKMNANNIDIKVLPKGVYIIKISDDVSQTYRKFIKN